MCLSELAAVGPFFVLHTGGAPEGGPGRFLPLGEEAVRLRTRTVAERLGTAEMRVAASIAFQGIAGRLLSVALGAAVLTGRVPDLSDDTLRWHPGGTAPDDLWLPGPAVLPADADPAGRIAATVLHGRLTDLHHTFRTVTPVSPRLLWGNAGSSLAGSLRVLCAWCRAHGRPQDAQRALDIARALFEDPLLRDTGTLGGTATADGPSFRRRSCCLYYRVPSGGLCGDCVLRHRPRST